MVYYFIRVNFRKKIILFEINIDFHSIKRTLYGLFSINYLFEI